MRTTNQNLLQVPGGGVPQAATIAVADCEDQELEQQTLICTVPTTMSTTCKNLHMCIVYHTPSVTGNETDWI